MPQTLSHNREKIYDLAVKDVVHCQDIDSDVSAELADTLFNNLPNTVSGDDIVIRDLDSDFFPTKVRENGRFSHRGVFSFNFFE